MPHDDRSIEVYHDGDAPVHRLPATRLSPEQTQAFLENAARERKRLTAERRKASARAPGRAGPRSRAAHPRRGVPVLPPAPATSWPPGAATRCCAARPAATSWD
jgi:hypothetical protein